jgi:hypothetical protein
LLPKGIAADCARPSDTLAAEKYFSDVHAAGKMIYFFRVCGRELCEAFFPISRGIHMENMWITLSSPTGVETVRLFPPCPVEKKHREIQGLSHFSTFFFTTADTTK